MSSRIVIFAKAPIPGTVKTRLIPALGAEGAARLAAEMLARTIDSALRAGVGSVELCADPAPDDEAWEPWRDSVDLLTAQGEGDLGARLSRAAERVIEQGEAAILIGTDCPGLDAPRLRAAADVLNGHDAMIHPTADGGYALLALDRFDPALFRDIAWSTGTVAQTTIDRIARLGWSLRIGETLRDVDEPADLL